ncbi:MAG: cytochrome c-type biogenesis protein CcmH [Caulobacteraceae bacterium]|nr:cytochrome c-type biogenesis protein CcmH [Caulobacteraceae bacterium]
MRRFLCALAGVVVAAGPACAVLPSEQLHDPKLEARARHIGDELRCVVCQNETIDQSDAPLAHDLRVILRQRLIAGDTDRQAIDYIVARYGHFVLLKPPFETQTLLLWLGPFLVLVVGAVGLGLMARSAARSDDQTAPLTPEEMALLRRRLEGEEGP